MDIKKYAPFFENSEYFNCAITENFSILDDIPKGWHNIFLEICEAIYNILTEANYPLNTISIFGVKEKYGYLRIMYRWNPNECDIDEAVFEKVHMLIVDKTEKTLTICSDCGATPTPVYYTRGYILPYCKTCANEVFNKGKEKWKLDCTFNEMFSVGKVSFDQDI